MTELKFINNKSSNLWNSLLKRKPYKFEDLIDFLV
jgi:hypothetical protein